MIWWRVAWWVVALPIAVACWAATLVAGWPRRGAFALAAFIALIGVVAVTSSDDEPAETAEVLDDAGAEDSTESTVDEDPETTEDSTDNDEDSEPERLEPSTTDESSPEPEEATTDPETSEEQLPDAASTIAALEVLRALVADPDPARPHYDRDAFHEGADFDGDCVRTRHEVLQEEAIAFSMSASGCTVETGEWYDPFTGDAFTDPADLQVDHVVALGDAWRSGAWAWSDNDREQFSNDLTNLNAIAGGENQAKSDDGPAAYTPSNPGQTCAYLAQYAAVKAKWRLTITRADFDAIEQGIALCDIGTTPSSTQPPVSTTTSSAPTTTTSPTTTASACHPDYSPCLPIVGDINCGDLPSSLKPVTVKMPGVDPYGLDGDSDGIGCEGG